MKELEAKVEYLLKRIEEQQAKEVMDILDACDNPQEPNDILEAALRYNETIRQKLEEGEEEGFDDDLMDKDCKGFDRLKESVKELEPYSEERFGKHFGSTRDKINNEILQLIAENNTLQEDRWKNNEEVLMKIYNICKLLNEMIDSNHSLIKLTETMVSANNIALNNVEKDLYVDERFVFNEKSYEEFNKETLPQIKCYCGHTIMCDCEPLNRIEKSRESEAKQMDITDAVHIIEAIYHSIDTDTQDEIAFETCIAWIKAELHDKNVDKQTLADAHREERMNIIGQNGNDGLHYKDDE